MSRFDQAQERDMVLFVGSYLKTQHAALAKLGKRLGKELIACVLLDDTEVLVAKKNDPKVVELLCDFSSDQSLQKVFRAESRCRDILHYVRRSIAGVECELGDVQRKSSTIGYEPVCHHQKSSGYRT